VDQPAGHIGIEPNKEIQMFLHGLRMMSMQEYSEELYKGCNRWMV